MFSLIENYRRFHQYPCVCEEAGGDGYDGIHIAFQEKLRHVSSSRKKVQTLHAKLKSTIELVSLETKFLKYMTHRLRCSFQVF